MLYENLNDLHKITDNISIKLHENSIVGKISSRLKDPCSITKKLIRKNVGFHRLTDTIASRIIVDKQEDCYKVLDILNDNYCIFNKEDYIANPKPNGYSSLHVVAAAGILRRNTEIQIRTRDMHHIAEFGTANHDEYKKTQEAKIKEIFSQKVLNVAAIHTGLNNAYKLFKQFNWTMLELMAYEQKIEILWHSLQDNLCKIREQFIGE
ncbi:bifunctional (p)ppGpp synthetase/guanosine-3',5'-bis(diphosphate) 3'-pyrophosphohydrolase [Candidatus Tisiphia endosymbiont of Ditula angustiorana]|uniref:bifunctional (p)ppGpp synthetase/guanosine-3',5'-bis(diphosphate) 3'-pyrophosphohydrolase n=1 Tax=Candidatus Tisiphia endosymbiont of Ditula angustiorana TaxID=3066272 RepID=UPI00312C708A